MSKPTVLLSRVLQKLAMSSAEASPPTALLQKASKASLSALWNSELLLKLSVTYCRQAHHMCHQPMTLQAKRHVISGSSASLCTDKPVASTQRQLWLWRQLLHEVRL